MRCEICQAKEATVHLTHRFPPIEGLNVPATEWKDHLCGECAIAYEHESDRFLHQQLSPWREGMSKEEQELALQALQGAQWQHMTEWKRKRSSQ